MVLLMTLLSRFQLIFSVLKTLTGQEVTVELKNDLSISGKLKSVDQSGIKTAQLMPSHAEILLLNRLYHLRGHGSTRFLNIKLDDIAVQQPERYPHLVRSPS
jgi:U6 snRNA-associated Sm-like protein LSm2